MNFEDDISVLKGIGKKKKEYLNRAGIEIIKDFALFFPYRYEDRRFPIPCGELVADGRKHLIEAVVIGKKKVRKGRNTMLFVQAADASGGVSMVFFNGEWLSNIIKTGEEYAFFGTVTEYEGEIQLEHPECVVKGSSGDVRGLIPVYSAIKGIHKKEMIKWQKEILQLYQSLPDRIPEKIREKYNLAPYGESLSNIHFPETGDDYLTAKYRLVFEEFYELQVGLMYLRHGKWREGGTSIPCGCSDKFIENLPFELTEDQEKTWIDIKKDMESNRIMNRLVQGDVGSGKTAIAEIALYCVAMAGRQGIMMAPTEILAKQHYRHFIDDFKKYGIEIGILTGSMSAKEKKETLCRLESGEIKILVSTHAVLEENVNFKDPALVITDEQHRFGVNQRKILNKKGENPDVLVMTATPIPRTLAVIIYGDLDISQIRTMPKGRKPIITSSFEGENRDMAYNFAAEKIKEGGQCYVVAPSISDRGTGLASVEVLYKDIKKRFPEFTVDLIHGEMRDEEKASTMKRFANGETDILVSTVIIEVGIDVANASVMIIENAERFGLSQLHQLRGRVGRGADQSWCLLIKGAGTENGDRRLDIMTKTSDGFVIAEEDLKLRGPGSIFGLAQHGMPEFIIADVVKNAGVMEEARRAAFETIKDDPELLTEENSGIQLEVMRLFGDRNMVDL